VAVILRALSLFGQRASKRASHAWKSLTRSGLFRLGVYLLVALCSLVDSLYVWIPLVAILTAYRPNRSQEVTTHASHMLPCTHARMLIRGLVCCAWCRV
jgi:hypothetical protein